MIIFKFEVDDFNDLEYSILEAKGDDCEEKVEFEDGSSCLMATSLI